MLRDRRGVGVAEYALLLFLMAVLAAVAFRYMGKNVKHAGNKTEEQFQANNNSGGANSAGGASSGGAGGPTAAGGGAGGGGNGQSGGGSGGGGGGASGGGGGGGNAQSSTGSGGGAGDEGQEEQSTPLWKIMGGVFLVLFAIGGYFAFRKQSKSG
jgi:Flp pilus assembly pilin Flp